MVLTVQHLKEHGVAQYFGPGDFTAHAIRPSFTSVSTFCDEFLLSSKDLVLTLKHCYVQTKQSTPISTMQKFIYSASWKPVPGGLTSDAEFCANRARLTMLYVFGKISRNNPGHKEQKRAKQVYPVNSFQFHHSSSV